MARTKVASAALNAEQQAEADRIFERLQRPFLDEARRIAQLLASKETRHLFGQTEYEVRDRVHALGAEALATAADERVKKGGLSGS